MPSNRSARAAQDLDHVASVLLAAGAVARFRRKLDLGLEMLGEIVEKLQPGRGIEIVAPYHCRHGERRSRARNAGEGA